MFFQEFSLRSSLKPPVLGPVVALEERVMPVAVGHLDLFPGRETVLGPYSMTMDKRRGSVEVIFGAYQGQAALQKLVQGSWMTVATSANGFPLGFRWAGKPGKKIQVRLVLTPECHDCYGDQQGGLWIKTTGGKFNRLGTGLDFSFTLHCPPLPPVYVPPGSPPPYVPPGSPPPWWQPPATSDPLIVFGTAPPNIVGGDRRLMDITVQPTIAGQSLGRLLFTGDSTLRLANVRLYTLDGGVQGAEVIGTVAITDNVVEITNLNVPIGAGKDFRLIGNVLAGGQMIFATGTAA